MALISLAKNELNEERRQELLQKKGALKIAKIEAEALAVWPKRLIGIGVIVNFALLIYSSLNGDQVLSKSESVFLLSISILIYVISIFWLSIIANAKLHSIIGD